MTPREIYTRIEFIESLLVKETNAQTLRSLNRIYERLLEKISEDDMVKIIAENNAKPKRIQRKRTKGWRMPPNTFYVGRPTAWGNPFETAEEYREYVIALGYEDQIRHELRGKNLACWCPLDQHCHADVLLELANK
jgi:Domain of unknown function (DUF4326)